MSFKAELSVSVGWSWSDGAVDSGRLACVRRLAEGNGDNQAEAVWHVGDQSLLDGESTTLDLTDLARLVFGDALTVSFLTVKALLVVSDTESSGRLLIGGADVDAWSAPFAADGDRVVLSPGSPVLLADARAGWTVDQAHRNLKLAADGGEVAYRIAVVGTITGAASGSGV